MAAKIETYISNPVVLGKTTYLVWQRCPLSNIFQVVDSYSSMEEAHRAEAILHHLAAHDAKVAQRTKSRLNADNRKKKRGLAAAVAAMVRA